MPKTPDQVKAQALQLQTDMLVGIEGGRARARHVLHAGETVYCALAWSEQARVPTTVEEAREQLEAVDRHRVGHRPAAGAVDADVRRGGRRELLPGDA